MKQDPALVTEVVGATRSLAEVGIPSIIVSEYPNSPSFWSRHCYKRVLVPDVEARAEEALQVYLREGPTFPSPPVIFNGRESDILFASRFRKELASLYRFHLPPEDLIEAYIDKWKFWQRANALGLRVPMTWKPKSEKELSECIQEISFPCILKPISQRYWSNEAAYKIVGWWAKAFLARSAKHLREVFPQLLAINPEFLIQEYIPGEDNSLFSFHSYCTEPGKVAAQFQIQKIRTCPIHFGRGCYTRSADHHDVKRIALETLDKLEHVGPSNMNLKVDPRTGKAWVLEVNPRFSLCSHLGSRAGVNLPLVHYRYCRGEPLPNTTRDSKERRWLYVYLDVQSFRQYRKIGEWNLKSWLKSLCFPRIMLYRFDPLDPGPLLRATWNYVWQRILWRMNRLRQKPI